MKNFLDEALTEDEKDPADPGKIKKPDWEGMREDDKSADENADSSASDDASGNQGHQEQAAAPQRPARAPRRTGRPRGPERRSLGTRILLRHDRQLTVAVEQLGVNPQTVVDQALEMFFRKHKIEDPGEQQDQEDGAA